MGWRQNYLFLQERERVKRTNKQAPTNNSLTKFPIPRSLPTMPVKDGVT